MCGRYSLTTDPQALIDFFEVGQLSCDPAVLHPRFNIAPSQEVPIVREATTGRELVFARWGLVPHWSKEENPRYSTINARAESVADKPTYREPFKRKRCLVPATGFYEWRQSEGGKTPYSIRLPGGQLFAFAGLWDHWDREGAGFDSFTVIVTTANEAMRPIHERMPVILNPAQYNTWLNTKHFNRAQLEALLVPYGGAIEIAAVGRHVNNPKNDDARCLERSGN